MPTEIVTYREPVTGGLVIYKADWKERLRRFLYRTFHSKSEKKWSITTPFLNSQNLWEITVTEFTAHWPWETPECVKIKFYTEDNEHWRNQFGDEYDYFRQHYLKAAVNKVKFQLRHKFVVDYAREEHYNF